MTTSRIKNVLVCVLALAAFAAHAVEKVYINEDTALSASAVQADYSYVVSNGVTLTLNIDSDVQCSALRGDGKVIKNGSGILTLSNDNNGAVIYENPTIVIAEGSICVSTSPNGKRPFFQAATFILGENSADIPLYNSSESVEFEKVVTISNEFSRTVFSSNSYIYKGKFKKGGEGALCVRSKVNDDTSIDVQGGELLLEVAEGQDYTYNGTLTAQGRFGKSGAGVLTLALNRAQNFYDGIDVVDGELVLSNDYRNVVAGVYGAGTLVNASTSTLYLVCHYGSSASADYSNTYAVDGGTVKTTSGDISLGKDPDRGFARNATFVLDGGTLTGYGWPRFYGTNVFDVTTDATIYKNTDKGLRFCGNSTVGCTILKKGAATLTFDIDIGEESYPGKTALVIEEGRVCYQQRESFNHAIRCNSITGAGDFYVADFPVGVGCSGLHISNLTLSENASFKGTYKDDITITGRLYPRRALADLSQTFTFADGATIDVSALKTYGGTFGGNGVFFNSAAGATVTVDVGDRNDFKSGDYLCRLGAKPTMNLALSGTKVATWKAVGVDDGIKVIAPGLVIFCR